MTLLELLVQELPKLGGWPDNGIAALNHPSGLVGFYIRAEKPILMKDLKFTGAGWGARKQYEAALAASNQPEWDGEGLPPVGCECMVKGEIRDDNFYKCKILNHTIFRGIDCAVFQTDKTVSVCSAKYFRPILTEAERKREAAIKEMMDCSAVLVEATAGLIYDAVAAGEIKAFKLAC